MNSKKDYNYIKYNKMEHAAKKSIVKKVGAVVEKITKETLKPEQIVYKAGDRILLRESPTKSNFSSVQIDYRTRKIYGVVNAFYDYSNRNIVCCDSNQVSATFGSYNSLKSWGLYCKDIELIAPEDYKKYEEIHTKEFEKEIEEQKEVISKLLIPGKGYQNIDILDTNIFLDKPKNLKLVTSVTYANKHTIDWKTGKIIGNGSIGYAEDCCDYIKNEQDFIFYFPMFYLNYYSYTVYDLSKWLQFLENCDINFKYILEGECDVTPYKNQINKALDLDFDLRAGTTIRPSAKTKFIEIKVCANKNAWAAYLYLNLIRMMYYPSQWFLPAMAMQIKDQLEEKITNWQALLMTIFHPGYQNNRALMNQNGSIIDIKQSPKDVYDYITKNSCLQAAFKQRLGKNSSGFTNCRKLVKEKKYEELLTYLKQY